MKIKHLVAGMVLIMLSFNVNAGIFDGQTIGYQYYFGSLSQPYGPASQYYVGLDGVTIPAIAGSGTITLKISGNDLTLSFSSGSSRFGNATFNGFVISDTNLDFTSFLLTNNTALSGSPSLSFDSHNLYVNMQGLIMSPGTVTLTAAVPEPETYAMFLMGLGLMGFVARRRKSNQS